ncbi:MAG: hypothetical protein HOV80_01410 [Polyangiaceae bacterium]|nr:hypothetical protein [Polyangiaceae bacterium]
MLEARPDLVAQLRQRFAASGMTKEQIHARLKAEGYPEDLLDPYLNGATGSAPPPGSDVFSAVRALGVADSADIELLRRADSTVSHRTDSIPPRRFYPRVPAGSSDLERDSILKADAPRDSGFKIFGLEVFQNFTSQFEPNLSGPVDANYRLGPGDRLVLILTGEIEASYQLDVTREGFIVIPQVGQLYVANLTLGELEQLLRKRLPQVHAGIRPDDRGSAHFSISVAKLHSNQVYVVGDVQRPGSFMVSSAGTVLTALYAAGGPAANGSLRRIEVRRGGRSVDVLDVYDYLVRGDASHDARLQTGDIVFVPVHGPRVRIVGAIARPATYEAKAGETLADLIRAAGGFRATASRQRVLIERVLPPDLRRPPGHDRITIDVASTDTVPGAGIALQDEDVVRIFAVAERLRNRIAVNGNVYQKGAQGMTPGMQLSDALRRAGVKPDTYLGEVLVSRIRMDSTREQLRATLADTTGRVLNDFPLREDDQIQVFSLIDFRPERYVAIGGAVKKGGRFPYHVGMTLRDLILMASGLDESAYLGEAQIARLPTSRDSGRTAVTLRTPLDSTYLVERAAHTEYLGPPGESFAASGAPDVVLRPYDNVLILRQPEWELQRVVNLLGEVRFPGAYALVAKGERLADLIARAGGLTPQADADGIIFTRTRDSVGRIGVELSAALRNARSNDNLILRDGDIIEIPPFNSIVTIKGAVNSPSTVAYVPGKGIDYYIGAAGGASRTADEHRAYVVQPGGKRETVQRHFGMTTSMPRPRPGSIVTVPEFDQEARKNSLALMGSIAQVLASTVAIVIAVTR